MKLRFSISLVPPIIGNAVQEMGGQVVNARVQFDVTLGEPHTREGMIAYFESFGAEFVADDPQDSPSVQ